MWTILKKSPLYFIHFDKESRFHIHVTDYIRIWEVYFSENDLIKCLKVSNEGLEMESNELLEKGIEMLTYPENLKSVCISLVNTKLLEVTMTLFCGFPFNLKITLLEGPPELLFKKLTQPALKTIDDLKSSENTLRETLIKKDDEIEQYKRLGGKIRYTAIPSYNDVAHTSKHNAYKKHFGDKDIPKDLINREVIIASVNTIKEETQNTIVKSEPLSQSTNCVSVSKGNEVYTTVKTERIKTESQPRQGLRSKKKKLNI